MKKILTYSFLFCIFYPIYVLSFYSEKDTNEIKKNIDEIINHADSNIQIGIKILSLSHEQTLYEKNENQLFIPASLNKLFVAVNALIHLKRYFTFRTSIFVDYVPYTGIIDGDMCIKGSGDPSLQVADVQKLVEIIKKAGIKKINGNIIVDPSVFDNKQFGKGWMWDDGASIYNSPISGLSLNHNCIDITVLANNIELLPDTQYVKINDQRNQTNEDKSPIKVSRRWETRENIIDITGEISNPNEPKTFTFTIENPEIYTGTIFKELLEKNNISVKGKVIKDDCPPNKMCLVRHESNTLADIIKFLLKNSDNLYAECLLKKIGASVSSEQGTAVNGINVILNFIKEELKLDISKLFLVDGSGLSRYNLISPSQLMCLLIWLNNNGMGRSIISCLPIAGVDGTLKNRMLNTAGQSNVQAKTGTMRGVTCLCGYLTTQEKDNIAFVILINGFTKPAEYYKTNIEDKICTYLCEYSKKIDF